RWALPHRWSPWTRLCAFDTPSGSAEERMSLAAFLSRCEPYFAGAGGMVDQAYQSRLPEGMVRCYLVGDRVAGFGEQLVNALYPAARGASPSDAPQPGPRNYFP